MYTETMNKLFVDAYIGAALWASLDGEDQPLDDNYSRDDLAPEALQQMVEEAETFFTTHIDLINQTPVGYGYGNAGHDLWLTRCGHGAGFWDGDAGEAGNELDKFAQALGDQHLYVGDDGKLYLM